MLSSPCGRGTGRPGLAGSPLNGREPGDLGRELTGGPSPGECLGGGCGAGPAPWAPRSLGSGLESRLLYLRGRWKQMHVSVPEAGGSGVGGDCHS